MRSDASRTPLTTVVLCSLPLLAATAGALATIKHGAYLPIGALAVWALVSLIGRFGIGVPIGLALIGAVDALPGPNLETTKLPLGLYGIDIDILGLIGLVAYVNYRTNWGTLLHTRIGRASVWWSVALIGWWLFTLARTLLFSDVTLSSAAYFGHDFLFFAISLPLLFEPLRDPRIRSSLLWTLAAGVALIALVQIAGVLGHSISVLLTRNRSATQLMG